MASGQWLPGEDSAGRSSESVVLEVGELVLVEVSESIHLLAFLVGWVGRQDHARQGVVRLLPEVPQLGLLDDLNL